MIAPSSPPTPLFAADPARESAGARVDEEETGAPLLEALLAAPPQPSRLGLPSGAVPVARTAAVLLAIAVAGAIGGARLGAPTSWVRLFDNLHWTIADLAAAWLAWIGVRDAREKGLRAEFVARRWFALGFSSYAIGQMFWNLQVFLGWQPFPAPSDPFYMMLSPCCAVGMMSFLRGRVSETQRLAAVLDTLTLAIAVVAVALVAYLPERGDTTPLALGVMIAYPTMLFAASCIGLMLLALLRVGRGWSAWMLTLQLAVQGGLWMEWNALTLRGALADGGLVNSTFSVFTLAGGLAVSTWRVHRSPSPRVDRFYEGALRILPLLVVVGVTFAVTLQDSIAQLSPAARVACDAAAVIVIVLAAARQTLLLRDRDQLVEAQLQLRDREEELRELNQHLEQRVSERTREAEARNAELTAALQQLSTVQQELVRSEKLAGLGALVTGVAEEMSAALGNARMVAATLPTHVSSISDLQAAANEDPGRTPGAERRLARVGTHVTALGDSHRQLDIALELAQRMIAGFQQLAIDQTTSRRRSFDVLATVREVVEIAQLSHRREAVEIVVTGEPELVMNSYPGPIGQVLVQLIDNAVVHGFADHREGIIEVRVWPSGRDAVRLTVRDNGVGIPPAQLSQVFVPFFTTQVVHEGGTGLGLTISRNLITGILGGRIEIVSPPEAGTTVTVTLPRVAPGAAPQ